MPDSPSSPPNRRRILGSSLLGTAAGLLTGLIAGVAVALPPKSPPVPPLPGRRRFEGKSIVYTPTVANGRISWKCSTPDIDLRFLPAECARRR